MLTIFIIHIEIKSLIKRHYLIFIYSYAGIEIYCVFSEKLTVGQMRIVALVGLSLHSQTFPSHLRWCAQISPS